MLTAVQIDEFKNELGQSERLLRGEVRRAIQDKLGRDIPEFESMGDDSAQSVADLLDDIDTGMMMRDVEELAVIEAARKAINAGSYGVCVVCHGPIGFKRLLASPSAARCLTCQEQHERTTWQQPERKL